jgi:hypothetical protein
VTPEQMQQFLDALQAQGGAVGDLRDELQALTDAQLELARVQSDAADAARNKANAAIQQEIEYREGAAAALDIHESAVRNNLATAKNRSEALEHEIELIEIEIERLVLASKARGANTVEIMKQVAAMKERRNAAKGEKKDVDNLIKSTDSLSKSLGSMLGGTAPSIDSILNPDTLMKNAEGFKKLMEKSGGAAGAMQVLAKNAAKAGLLTLATNIIKLSVELGNAENSFMRATNASRDFARNITLTYQEGRKFAATSEDMFASATALTKGFTDFTMQSDAAKREIVTQTAALDKLGLSNDAVSKSLQLMTKGFGMTGKQGVQELTNLEKFSTNLGVPLSQLGADFQAAGGSLAKLGDNGMDAFKGLAKAAKITGLEMGKILNIVNKFDTFEGAARSAGKLNAALGGNFVNAMDLMMETDPSARLNQIRDAVLDTGLSFDEMSYYQRNFYKDAMGLDSVADLAAVLSGEMDSVGEETMKSSQEMKEMRDRAKETASFQEQLNAVFAQMIPILTPLIDAFSGLMSFVSENIGMFKILGAVLLVTFGGIPGVVIAIVGLLDAIKMGSEDVSALSVLLEGIMIPFKILGAGLTTIKNALDEVLEPFGGLMGALEPLIPVLKVVGMIIGGVLVAKLAMIIGPITAVIAGITMLVGVFSDLGQKLFKESFASTFLEGLAKVATAVGSIAVNVIGALNPITQMTKFVEALGNTFTGIIDSVASFFTVLTAPEAAQNMQDIANAIIAIPTTKNIEFVASMAAAAGTATIGAAASTVTAIGGAAAEGITSFFGGDDKKENQTMDVRVINDDRPIEVSVELNVDRDKLATVVEKINGKSTQSAMSSRR